LREALGQHELPGGQAGFGLHGFLLLGRILQRGVHLDPLVDGDVAVRDPLGGLGARTSSIPSGRGRRSRTQPCSRRAVPPCSATRRMRPSRSNSRRRPDGINAGQLLNALVITGQRAGNGGESEQYVCWQDHGKHYFGMRLLSGFGGHATRRLWRATRAHASLALHPKLVPRGRTTCPMMRSEQPPIFDGHAP